MYNDGYEQQFRRVSVCIDVIFWLLFCFGLFGVVSKITIVLNEPFIAKEPQALELNELIVMIIIMKSFHQFRKFMNFMNSIEPNQSANFQRFFFCE